MNAPAEIRGTREGFKELLDSGVTPDQVAYAAVGAMEDVLRELMHAVGKDTVSYMTRIQIAALATNVTNCKDAIRPSAQLPLEVREKVDQLIAALGEALGLSPEDVERLDEQEQENAGREGQPSDEKEQPDGDSATREQ